MRKQVRVLASIVLCFAATTTLFAGRKDNPEFVKGEQFYLLLPANISTSEFEDLSISEFDQNIEIEGKRLEEWYPLSAPNLIQVSVKAVKFEKRTKRLRLKLKVESGRSDGGWIDLASGNPGFRSRLDGQVIFRDRYPADAAFNKWNQLFVDTYLNERLGTGLTASDKKTLTDLWGYWSMISGAPDPGFELVESRSKKYLGVYAGSGRSVYNTLQVSRRGMVARFVSPDLISNIKKSSSYMNRLAFVDGLSVVFLVPYRDFSETYSSPDYLECRLVVDTENIEKLSSYEITDQELLDISLLICSETRMKIDLGSIE